mmetsp:Transcript_52175/g.52556  ORF Transcript_52175/g.52556 Transcript_52175/m.52556 type:complete len:93 (+) Transcript_52175:469-747(+)
MEPSSSILALMLLLLCKSLVFGIGSKRLSLTLAVCTPLPIGTASLLLDHHIIIFDGSICDPRKKRVIAADRTQSMCYRFGYILAHCMILRFR